VGVAEAQTVFKDDAGRSVVLPASVDRVFAAGAPAEILLYTLAPEKLAGRNHQPPAAALPFMPPEYRALRQVVNLPDRDDPKYDAELLALDVDVYVDYGTIDAAGHVYAPPDLPFNWGPRPPSVNRMPSLIWLAYVARGRPFDDEFREDVSRLFAALYHVTPTAAQLEQLTGD